MLPHSSWSNVQTKSWRIFAGCAPPPLTHEEFVSLRDCAKGLMHRAIPVEHKDRLIQLGYIQELSGGLRLTSAGRLRIVEGE
jgi:hypothetical protein